MNHECFILHLEKYGLRVAMGSAGVSWKTPKVKNPEGIHCDLGVQMVHVQHIFVTGIIPMFTKENNHIKVLDECLDTLFPSTAWVRWHTHFLAPVD